MTLADLKAELGDVRGVDTLSVRYGDGLQFVTYNGRTTALSESASIDEIRMALNLAKIDGFIAPVAFVDIAQIKEIRNMATIAEQLAEARAKLAEARKGAADAVADSADAASVVLREIEKVQKETAELRAEVAALTNGGPAL